MINFGSTGISSIYRGGDEITKVYKGTDLVFLKSKILYNGIWFITPLDADELSGWTGIKLQGAYNSGTDEKPSWIFDSDLSTIFIPSSYKNDTINYRFLDPAYTIYMDDFNNWKTGYTFVAKNKIAIVCDPKVNISNFKNMIWDVTGYTSNLFGCFEFRAGDKQYIPYNNPVNYIGTYDASEVRASTDKGFGWCSDVFGSSAKIHIYELTGLSYNWLTNGQYFDGYGSYFDENILEATDNGDPIMLTVSFLYCRDGIDVPTIKADQFVELHVPFNAESN